MTGRSLPGDLQRLLGARRAAGARSPSAGISKARSGRGPDGRLRGSGSGSDAPPAPGPRPGPAPRGPARAPRQRAVQAARWRSGPPGARRGVCPPLGSRLPPLPTSPPADGRAPRPSLAAPSPSPPLRSPVPAPAGGAPGSLPRQRRLTRSPSPARRDTSPMLSLSLKHRKKKHAPRPNARPQSVRNCLPAQDQAVREGTRRFLPERLPGVLTQRDATSCLSPSPGKSCRPRLEGGIQGWRLPGLGSVPSLTFVCPALEVCHKEGSTIGVKAATPLPRVPGCQGARGAPTPHQHLAPHCLAHPASVLPFLLHTPCKLRLHFRTETTEGHWPAAGKEQWPSPLYGQAGAAPKPHSLTSVGCLEA